LASLCTATTSASRTKASTSSSISSLLHINESKAKLVHKEAKNLLRVDEKGSEGAAATAIFTSRMMFVPKTTINIDRTFFLSVVHKQSGVTAFAAKVDQPDPI